MIRWLLLGFCAAAVAQTPDPRVDWSSSWSNPTALELTAHIENGWHVYALTQKPGGPIPLRVSIDDNPVAGLANTPSGSPPETRLDPSFNLQTEFYTNSFSVHVPVRLKSDAQRQQSGHVTPNSSAAAGQSIPVNSKSGAAGQSIPVSIRFQACSPRECKPPKTIHLSIEVPS